MTERVKTCKYDDCNQPRHVYPGGAAASYCSAHNRLRVRAQFQYKGARVVLSEAQWRVLKHLHAARDADIGYYFVALPPGVDRRTTRRLIQSGWIFESPGMDGVRYKLLREGAAVLKRAGQAKSARRTDGLCPRCSERPRPIRKKGKKAGMLAPYCSQCQSQIHRRRKALGIARRNPDGICPRCQKRKRYISPSGCIHSYCQHCKNVLNRRHHRKERRALLKRIQAGEHIPCTRKDCDAPRYVSGKSVQDYCYEHHRQYMNAYNARRRQQAAGAMARSGGRRDG